MTGTNDLTQGYYASTKISVHESNHNRMGFRHQKNGAPNLSSYAIALLFLGQLSDEQRAQTALFKGVLQCSQQAQLKMEAGFGFNLIKRECSSVMPKNTCHQFFPPTKACPDPTWAAQEKWKM